MPLPMSGDKTFWQLPLEPELQLEGVEADAENSRCDGARIAAGADEGKDRAVELIRT